MTIDDIDLTGFTFKDLSALVLNIWLEVKRRNPIGVNWYGSHFMVTANALQEISEGEKSNPTSENGPQEKK